MGVPYTPRSKEKLLRECLPLAPRFFMLSYLPVEYRQGMLHAISAFLSDLIESLPR